MRRTPMRTSAVFITAVLMCVVLPLRGQVLQSEVRYEARDSIRYDLKEQTVYLFGAATVKYQGIQLTADRIAFSFKNEEASAFGAPDSTGAVVGKPQFAQDGHTIDADSIRYNFRTKTGMIREVRTEEQTAWLSASLSKRHPSGEVHGKGGMLTTCDRPHPHYHFKVSRMIVVPDDKIVAGPAYMKVGNVPTPLALPFATFPNRKGGSGGVLIPTWGDNANLGFFLLNGGYYLPVNDHFDLQLTGDIYSKGSWAARALARYRTRYRYTGNLNLSHSTLLNSDPDFPDFSKQQNFFVRWNHQMDPKASLTDRFSASLNVGTSNNFTNNFNSSFNDYISNTFQSNVQWTHLWTGKPYNLAVSMRHSQNTLNRTFDITLPSATFNLQRILPIQMLRPAGAPSRWYDQLAVNYTAQFDNRLSTTEDQIYLGNISRLAKQMQNGVRQATAVTTTFKSRFFTFNPEFRFTERWYTETLRKTYFPDADTTITDTVPGFSRVGEWGAGATLTSKLYGMYIFRGERLKAIRHTLTPSVGLTYRPDQSTEVFGPYGPNGALGSYSPYDIGIYGKPAAGESGTLNLGLIQNVEAKVRDGKASRDSVSTQFKKMKLIDFLGINSSYDMLRDSVRWSPVNISARTALFNLVNVNLVSIWDPYAVNTSGQRIDRSERSVSGKLARMVYTNVAVGFDLKSKRYGQPLSSTDTGTERVVEDSDPTKGSRQSFNMPWRLGVNYSYDINRSYLNDTYIDSERQSVLFNGDVTVLKYWKLGVSSGYDIVAEELTPTSLNLYWDLHCWEFNANVIPFGERKSFMLRLNIKASILRDLKVEQRLPIGGAPSNRLY
ncbi:MAG: LPS-assembly protein LptD [Flavobacteriales bacterium]|nr:LPS-assembly protein LptD [Flavobacteriales bacterium]